MTCEKITVKGRVSAATAALAALAAILVSSPPVSADPSSSTDIQYLRALNHGGVCCQWQPDVPIWHASADEAIDLGHVIAQGMTANPTYEMFNNYRAAMARDSRKHGTRPLDSFETGEVVVVAVRYYAPLSVEHQLISSMGDGAGYWYGQEVRTQLVPVR